MPKENVSVVFDSHWKNLRQSHNLNHSSSSGSAFASNTHTGSGVNPLWTNFLGVNANQNLGSKNIANNAIVIKLK